MVYRVLVFFVFLSVCLFGVFGKPAYKSEIKSCYEQQCPPDTFACEKLTRVSTDKKSIETEVHCLGFKGDILSNVTLSKENPYGPSIHFQGYSYTGSFSFTRDNDSGNTKEADGKQKGTEGYSEVDDLNKSVDVE